MVYAMNEQEIYYIMYKGDKAIARASTLEELAVVTGQSFDKINYRYTRRKSMMAKYENPTFVIRNDETFDDSYKPRRFVYKWILGDEEFIGTAKEYAAMLDVSLATLTFWRKQKKLVREKISGTKYFSNTARTREVYAPIDEVRHTTPEERKRRDVYRKLALERAWKLGI